MSWHGLRIVPSGARDEIIAALFAAGAQAVEENGPEVVTHFPPGADVDEIRHSIEKLDPGAQVKTSATPEINPATLHGTVSTQRIGRITIAPPWESAGLDPDGLVLIDPSTAFGTGEHATTRGVIRLMQKILKKGDIVADLGTGSAVLGIAAARLGASRVFAIENDPQAIGNAEANIQANHVAEVVTVFEGEAGDLAPLIAPLDLILANIVSSVLVTLMPVMTQTLKEDGYAILSGILGIERDMIMESASVAALELVDEDFEGEWWSVLLKRR